MTKRIHYALTTGLWHQGISVMTRRTITLQDTEDMFTKIQDDLTLNGIHVMPNIDVECDSIALHYVQDGDEMITNIDNDHLYENVENILSCNIIKNIFISNKSEIVDDGTDKYIHYMITYQQYYDDCYPHFKMNKVCVKTHIELINLVQIECTSIFKNNKHIEPFYIHYIIENIPNSTWQELCGITHDMTGVNAWHNKCFNI